MAAFSAKATAARWQRRQSQQQQPQGLGVVLTVEDPRWADDSFCNLKVFGHPVWGVYVAADEW